MIYTYFTFFEIQLSYGQSLFTLDGFFSFFKSSYILRRSQKFEKIFQLRLNFLVMPKTIWTFFQIFVPFWEYMNFTVEPKIIQPWYRYSSRKKNLRASFYIFLERILFMNLNGLFRASGDGGVGVYFGSC